jgi:hypothetical protein
MSVLHVAYHNLQTEWLRAKRLRAWPRQRREVEARLEVLCKQPEAEKGPETLVVVCLVRDGEDHVETFVEHHLGLGARQIVLLDNGSADSTAERALRLDRVTVLRCLYPYKTHSYAYKRFLVERFGEGSWCLLADIDERFDYPFSDRLPLAEFLRYLNRYEYTAVLCQMLDLFPDGPPAAWPTGGRDLIDASVWYDVSDVRKTRPWRPLHSNRFADPGMTMCRGGIRRTAFNARSFLSKFALLHRRQGDGPVLESAHLCRGGRVADVSAVLLHYKYDRAFRQRCAAAVKEGNFYGGSSAYRLYLKALEERPDLTLRGLNARRFTNAAELLEEGFLRASSAYREYVVENGQAAANSE